MKLPAANTALEGLCRSGDALCTRVKPKVPPYYVLSRPPGVLARFYHQNYCHKPKYPFLLSNGNRVAQGELENGRHWVQWRDPFPKPCLPVALVAAIR
ncbi:hypothetical protein ACNKHM_01790 [Shigella sonnei]